MKKFRIYRCLPFKVWHQPFEKDGSEWRIGGYRDECSCPYENHTDVRYLDYKDPLHLKEILSLEKGTKLLTFYSWEGEEHFSFHTFERIDFYSDFMRLIFQEEVDVCEYGGQGEQFTSLRLIAVIDDADEISAFGNIGDINVFMEELSKISGSSIEEIKKQIEELDTMLIPPELKISTKEITEDAKKSGRLAKIFY
ncbi:TPA: hypothetical protein DEP30_02745 [Candidatus Nomurabacteria bacterium]|nr:MAG: hypothetical protein UR97_C0004G0055 [Candidatus Nomurabacteria bacterium GW2011_GWE2_36_115]KKP94186.1 MAG: hypothetical protein US00_C0003G0110 [Candidatus Nomurabacteria bacterium GW2011_GWF2_36_126]KKP96686.1 MAG: hypothetical protein US04_C0001G0188 [Candidatus Nomurabacteria bacterium GW2011_GWD2_36_14]KKP99710.1 MAG: hypothetical protein US08_C0001G0393 [Candidatus Nomurabacteria bacterium GW2011_GWF2_36_19]KKQ05344.1 MAG: hypothetical protein US17_C0005G0111 [Candidatus Nomuraba